MKVLAALLFTLSAFVSTTKAGDPLVYSKDVGEICEFYGLLAQLKNEEGLKSIHSERCDSCCVSEITTAAAALVDSFQKMQSTWRLCDGDDGPSGCCLAGERRGRTPRVGQNKNEWENCFLVASGSIGGGATAEEAINKLVKNFFLTNGGWKTKWRNGVDLQFGRGSTRCRFTESDGWRDQVEYIGDLFSVEVDNIYKKTARVTLVQSYGTSGSLHRLLCMLARLQRGSNVDVHECEGICKAEAPKLEIEKGSDSDADQAGKEETQAGNESAVRGSGGHGPTSPESVQTQGEQATDGAAEEKVHSPEAEGTRRPAGEAKTLANDSVSGVASVIGKYRSKGKGNSTVSADGLRGMCPSTALVALFAAVFGVMAEPLHTQRDG
ncbi:hypothetical protein ERJ75_000490300 [Trypanosoma vivax]|uniref:Uncharacterized protein n=1 Tax=Trypanosoma vivax (strain Y486) TaxID=1055687 RepID=F9WUY4_TRYVY|nr:hypothetical protein ERJ75_000490300 [Trypanosoma vivax]CCD21384.1 hypothetical protein, conserved in T. vivax [Trypanosoma vivax Y486]|eukprot:CCD21384.1 hypothetical protein, conserved in T. vivax [Trypanosoma vivax Y486]